jgi:CheY-like chemotaxis protein
MNAPLALIVEDDMMNALLTKQVIERSGFRAVSTRSAEQARALLATEKPDIIIMDIQLPEMDGLAFTREIRANPATAKIAIVALTARDMAEDREAALAAGCDDFVVKPIELHTFAERLRSLLAAKGSG